MKITIRPEDIDALDPMPISVVQLASMAADPGANVNDMAEIIEFDEALTANMLRMANSVWGRAMTPILTVKDAVVRLGTGQILKLAVGNHVAGTMSRSCEGYELDEHELWRHSVCAALAAERLSDYLYSPVPRLAFTAALMHDIGKVLLERHLEPETIHEIREIIRRDKVSFTEAEKYLLGTDHSEVGGVIAEYWKFPPQLVDAIRLHHDPNASPDALLDIVYIANTVTKYLGVGLGAEEMNLRACEEAPKRLGIQPADLESLCAQVHLELAEAEQFFDTARSASAAG